MTHVKTQSRQLKRIFFISFVALTFASSFSSVFYKHVLVDADGKTDDHLLGWIFFIMPLVGIAANIPVGIIADKLHAGRRIIALFCFGLAFVSLLVGFAGSDWAMGIGLWPRFLYLFVALLFYNFFFQPIVPTIDAQTMIFLNEHGRREDYGSIRVYGTLGWTVASIAMGAVLFFVFHLPLIFYLSALMFAVLGVMTWRMIQARPTQGAIEIPWAHLRGDRVFMWFLVFSFLNGVVYSASFLFTGYLFDDVMQNPLVLGWVLGTWTLFEIPSLFFSRRLLTTFGHRNLIMISLLINGLRLVLFSFFTLETPFVWKWMIATLQGAAFGLSHLGTIDYVDRCSHPHMRNTYMNVINVARHTIASSIGGKVGALVVASYGASALMQFCGIASVLLMGFFALFCWHDKETT